MMFPVVGLMVFIIISVFSSSTHAVTDLADGSSLNVMFISMNYPYQLTKWVASGGDPCGDDWKGVTCSGSAVTEIKISDLELTGTIGYQLSTMTSLRVLDISNNKLGNLPYNLPPNLTRLNIAGNGFNGGIPYSISLMTTLKYLNVSHNQFQNQLDDMFGKLSDLSTMDLSYNVFPGVLPESFSSLSSMNNLFLDHNQFTGPINVLANLPLTKLSIANNRFTGWIPPQLKKLNLVTDGNSFESGPAPPPPPGTPGTPTSGQNDQNNNPGTNNNNNNQSSGGSSGRKSGIGGGAIAGILISLLVVGAIVVFFLLRRRRRTKRPTPDEEKPNNQSFPPPSKEVQEMKAVQISSAVDTKTFKTPAAINLRPPPMDRNKSFDDEDYTQKPIVIKKVNTAPIDAISYSIADLQVATGSFSVENLLGEGTFGRVYRAQFNDGKVLAVKKINSSILSDSNDFIDVVSNMSRLHHPNVTELVGYCSEHGQHLLVHEFHKNGSLHDYLHLPEEYTKPLIWNTRVKIALGTARALEYLHEVCSPSVVHKNFKSANILLGVELNPHLTDCGLASYLPNADQALIQDAGSAPEIAMSGQYTLKSDVYSFGVVMLELLTGRKPFDSSRSRAEQSLVRWATPQLHDIDALAKMVDPTLKGLYPVKSLSRFADVIALCVQAEPEFRPPMSEVVQALVRLVQRANMSKRTTGNEQGSSQQADEYPEA